MNTIILQKKYLVLVETAKDLWTLFLLIINYIFTIKERVDNVSNVLYSYFVNLNKVYLPLLIKVDNRQNDIAFKSNDDRYIYSNLLAPPCSR